MPLGRPSVWRRECGRSRLVRARDCDNAVSHDKPAIDKDNVLVLVDRTDDTLIGRLELLEFAFVQAYEGGPPLLLIGQLVVDLELL